MAREVGQRQRILEGTEGIAESWRPGSPREQVPRSNSTMPLKPVWLRVNAEIQDW